MTPRANNNGTRWRKVCQQVKASESVCALCGKPVDLDLPLYHPMSANVDHKTPLARGGAPYARDNLQLTHRGCNLRKGDGGRRRVAATSSTLPVSRDW